jgi:hypothetical protein
VSSAAPFDGDVAIAAEPIVVAQAVKLAGGERRTIIVPALIVAAGQSVEVQVRSAGEIRARAPLADTLRVARDAEFIEIKAPAGFADVDPAAFEAVDRLEGIDWKPRARFGVVEPAILPLLPAGAWIETKRDAAILFVVFYLFAAVVVLFGALRRSFGMLSVVLSLVALAAAFAGAFFALYPRGHGSVRAWAAVADGVEYRLHVPRGAAVTYSRLAKPMFGSFSAMTPVEILIDRGCTVIGGDAAMTSDVAPALQGSKPAAATEVDVRFFESRLGGATFVRADEVDPPLTGLAAPGLVETRLHPRLIRQER